MLIRRGGGQRREDVVRQLAHQPGRIAARPDVVARQTPSPPSRADQPAGLDACRALDPPWASSRTAGSPQGPPSASLTPGFVHRRDAVVVGRRSTAEASTRSATSSTTSAPACRPIRRRSATMLSGAGHPGRHAGPAARRHPGVHPDPEPALDHVRRAAARDTLTRAPDQRPTGTGRADRRTAEVPPWRWTNCGYSATRQTELVNAPRPIWCATRRTWNPPLKSLADVGRTRHRTGVHHRVPVRPDHHRSRRPRRDYIELLRRTGFHRSPV